MKKISLVPGLFMPAAPLVLLVITLLPGALFAQSDPLFIQRSIVLPKDSGIRVSLIRSLNGFLRRIGQGGESEVSMGEENQAATAILLDEMKGMGRNDSLKAPDFYKCYLTNCVQKDAETFIVQLSYIGLRDNEPVLRASFRLAAFRDGDHFYFFSPFTLNTIAWKTKKIGNCLFHYKNTLSTDAAEDFVKQIALHDKRLKAPPQTIGFYCCDDLPEAYQLLGMEYKMDYNSLAYEEPSTHVKDYTLVVDAQLFKDGFNNWNRHDWWHDRLHHMVSVDKINRPVDEGCAYLYGGSWQWNNWTDVWRMFSEYVKSHPDADWLALYRDGTNFIPPPKILKISYALNALICQRLEKEKGFPPVLELLTCGKKETGDANYFAALQRLTGVDTTGFNAYINGLIKAEGVRR